MKPHPVLAVVLTVVGLPCSASSPNFELESNCRHLVEAGEQLTSVIDQDLHGKGIEKIRSAFNGCNDSSISPEVRALSLLLAERLPEVERKEEIGLQERALAILHKEAPNSPLILRTLVELGTSQFEEGEHTQALDLAFESLSERKRLFGETSPSYVRGLTWISVIYSGIGTGDTPNPHLTSAYDYAMEAVELATRELGPHAPTTIAAKSNLASVLEQMSRDAEASALREDYLPFMDIIDEGW